MAFQFSILSSKYSFSMTLYYNLFGLIRIIWISKIWGERKSLSNYLSELRNRKKFWRCGESHLLNYWRWFFVCFINYHQKYCFDFHLIDALHTYAHAFTCRYIFKYWTYIYDTWFKTTYLHANLCKFIILLFN